MTKVSIFAGVMHSCSHGLMRDLCQDAFNSLNKHSRMALKRSHGLF
jgi:hypothetical protein